MYGLVNRAIQDLVVTHHGEATWQRIREQAGHDDETFVAMQTYPDELTYRLVGAACETLQLPADAILRAFGQHWILYTAQKGYGHMLDDYGSSTREFLQHLNDMHGRIETTFSEMSLPYFELIDSDDPARFELIYRSTRPGLTDFVVGLLEGLIQRFKEDLEVHVLARRSDGAEADLFRIQRRAG